MGHVKIIVDHDKIDYSGPLNVNGLLKLIELFILKGALTRRMTRISSRTPTMANL